MSHHLATIRLGSLTVECSYWPLSQAKFYWLPRREPLLGTRGCVVTWGCIDLCVTTRLRCKGRDPGSHRSQA